MLTKSQLRRAARAARDLAMECVAGTAPELGHSFAEPACAIGRLAQRVGMTAGAFAIPLCGALALDRTGWSALSNVYRANDDSGSDHYAAVVFPLLALADELDEAAVTSAASAAPKVTPT